MGFTDSHLKNYIEVKVDYEKQFFFKNKELIKKGFELQKRKKINNNNLKNVG